MKDGCASGEVEAGEGSFAEADAGRGGGWVVVDADAEEVAEELGEGGVVADDEDVFEGGGVAEEALELGEGGGGCERGGDEDLLLVAGLGGDELGGLLAALEGAGDDEVKAGLEGVEDVGELEALGFAVLVEGPLEVEEWVGALEAGAGVAEDVEVHDGLVVRCRWRLFRWCGLRVAGMIDGGVGCGERGGGGFGIGLGIVDGTGWWLWGHRDDR